MSATEGESERAGVLVIRAWLEPGSGRLRARITRVVDLAAPEEVVSATSSEKTILDEVGVWLRAVQGVEP